MADGVIRDDAGGDTARGLTYPFARVPEAGEAIEVAAGVIWLQLPLPMALNHINLYAIEDGDGWTLVDTGLFTPVSVEIWEGLLTGALGGRPIRRVICTHMHPDHIGMAGWLCERTGAPLLMSRLEYVTGRMLVADTGQPAPESGRDFYQAAGWTADQLEAWARNYGQFGLVVSPMPDAYHRLTEGDRLSIGGEDWEVVVGQGHSPEHVCLWRRSDGVFLGGDQILPKISSNVSVWPTEPLSDPLGDWMTSLQDLQARLPEDLLILPSHGAPFRGVQTRLAALLRGHGQALARLERRLQAPMRAVDTFASLFARPVGDGLRGMATGEAVAHLNYLERQGRATRHRDADGVDWWQAAGAPPSEENDDNGE
ncbi:MBL fold metallo-hydrolase [Brevundimonas sp.]|uniref:MBL fold metallo-hydrolase n=1 Tax=Brevundimonas sp. TaxID=1871086 RepID=UPI003AF697B6